MTTREPVAGEDVATAARIAIGDIPEPELEPMWDERAAARHDLASAIGVLIALVLAAAAGAGLAAVIL